MSTAPRPRAAFGIKQRDVPGVLFRSQTMADAIVAHAALFASPVIAKVTGAWTQAVSLVVH